LARIRSTHEAGTVAAAVREGGIETET
jgi:hypothetical protein